MKKISIRLISGLFMLFSILPAALADQKLKVVTTIFPLYDFARTVGGDKVDVSMLLPPGIEAHSFDPKPQDIVRLNKADVFIYTGQYMEPWATDVLKGLTNRTLVAVDASSGITLMHEDDDYEHSVGEGIQSARQGAGEHLSTDPQGVLDDAKVEEAEAGHSHRDGNELAEVHAEGGHPHHQDGKDPHIWLDPVLAQTMIDTIAQAFASKDPANSTVYRQNAEDFKARLKDIDFRLRTALSSCQINKIIYAGHFAFGYFARRYGLSHVSPYKGFSPDAEPSPRAIKEMIENIRAIGSNVIYYEELIDPKVGKIIADETGARLELLHGVHNVAKNDLATTTYLSIMEANMLKLKAGLKCK